jgi:hypothetical protein
MQDGDTRSLPAFGEIEARLGYNPARYLDQPAQSKIGDTSPLATTEALIRGMDDVDTVRAWLTVEVELGRGTDGGPRQAVITWLNQRQAQLEDAEDQSAEAPSDHDESNHEVADDGTHADAGEDEDEDETPSHAPSDTETDVTVTADTGADAVLADGGTTEETPTCAECQTELNREEIADKTGYWCPQCRDFREPAETEVSA